MTRAHPLPPTLQHRPFTVAEALALGVPANRLRAKDLVRPFHGVRAPAPLASDLFDRCQAYAQQCAQNVVFSHTTAARLLGIPLPSHLERDVHIHVLVVGGARGRRGVGVIGHKTKFAPHITVERGLPVTSPIHTFLALGDLLDVDDLIVAGDRLVGLPARLCSLQELEERVATHVRARGVEKVRLAMAEIRVGSRSPRETRTRLAIVRAGLPEPALNAVVLLPGGRRVHGDLVYEHEKVLLEYEGDHHRSDDRQWSHDLWRYNALSEAGWIVIRIGKTMSAAQIVAATRRALRLRGLQC